MRDTIDQIVIRRGRIVYAEFECMPILIVVVCQHYAMEKDSVRLIQVAPLAKCGGNPLGDRIAAKAGAAPRFLVASETR